MTKPDRDIPPGHTKPPIRNPGLPKDLKRDLSSVNPLRLPYEAKLVLILAMIIAFVITLLGDESLSGVSLVALVMVGAFGEAMRATRDERDKNAPAQLLPSIYDRAMCNVFWVALPMFVMAIIAARIRNALGMGAVVAG